MHTDDTEIYGVFTVTFVKLKKAGLTQKDSCKKRD